MTLKIYVFLIKTDSPHWVSNANRVAASSWGMTVRSATVFLCLVAVAALLGTTAEGVPVVQALRGFTSDREYQQLGTQLHLGEGRRELWEKAKASELSEQQCLDVLLPILPKVALMFLVLEDMPHEEVWHRWLVSCPPLVSSVCSTCGCSAHA